jgi:hypothetical protein
MSRVLFALPRLGETYVITNDSSQQPFQCIFYSLSQAASLIGVSKGWLRAQHRAGTGPPVLKPAGQYRYPKDQFLKWLAGQAERKS